MKPAKVKLRGIWVVVYGVNLHLEKEIPDEREREDSNNDCAETMTMLMTVYEMRVMEDGGGRSW